MKNKKTKFAYPAGSPEAVRENRKRNLRIFIITLTTVILLAWLIVYAMIPLVENHFAAEREPDRRTSSFFFHTADFDEDIFQDENYLMQNRFITYGGRHIGAERIFDRERFSREAAFLAQLLEYAINGDAKSYYAPFTRELLSRTSEFIVVEDFTMQRLYNIEIELISKREEMSGGRAIRFSEYKVSYKIMRNNGTFRNDMGSDMVYPLVYSLRTDLTTGNITVYDRLPYHR